VITGLDALELHGMQRAPRPTGPVHVLLPPERRVAGCGLVLVERTTRLPDPLPGRWPPAPLARAVLDFSRRTGGRDQVRAAIAEVVQRRRCTPAELAAELAAGSQLHSKLPREVLSEVSDGIRSAAEAKSSRRMRAPARDAQPVPRCVVGSPEYARYERRSSPCDASGWIAAR
jgi:hypothetical protein